MTYSQLALDERYQIQTLLRLDYSKAEIARRLGRHPSTISREIARNSEGDWYTARRADGMAHARQLAHGEGCRKIRGKLRAIIEAKLRLSWSPEQISGRLERESGLTVCTETIYQHVLRDKTGLRYCLRFMGYKHHRFKKSKHAMRTAAWRKGIDRRPPGATNRTERGHWERDLIEGTRSGTSCLLTIVDRCSRYTILRRVSGKSEREVGMVTRQALAPHRDLNKTMTNDNGIEFQRGKELEKELGIGVYYTVPASPWQRGTVENTNGLIRQYFRKGTNVEQYARFLDEAIEETLNHRPRKILGYRTPYEAFFRKRLFLMNSQSQLGLEFSSPS